jgi:hypothetical protein
MILIHNNQLAIDLERAPYAFKVLVHTWAMLQHPHRKSRVGKRLS